jgi:hypothetical protein
MAGRFGHVECNRTVTLPMARGRSLDAAWPEPYLRIPRTDPYDVRPHAVPPLSQARHRPSCDIAAAR